MVFNGLQINNSDKMSKGIEMKLKIQWNEKWVYFWGEVGNMKSPPTLNL